MFGRAFGVIMLVALPVILLNPKPNPRPEEGEVRGFPLWLQLPVYFAIGVYGGAIQAGIGIPLLLALVAAGGLDLVRANSVKVVVDRRAHRRWHWLSSSGRRQGASGATASCSRSGSRARRLRRPRASARASVNG